MDKYNTTLNITVFNNIPKFLKKIEDQRILAGRSFELQLRRDDLYDADKDDIEVEILFYPNLELDDYTIILPAWINYDSRYLIMRGLPMILGKYKFMIRINDGLGGYAF